MRTLELTKDACRLIAEAIQDKIDALVNLNYELREIRVCDKNDVISINIHKNNIKIGELKTLLDYIKTDL